MDFSEGHVSNGCIEPVDALPTDVVRILVCRLLNEVKFPPTITETLELLILVMISTKKAIESERMTGKAPKIYLWQLP